MTKWQPIGKTKNYEEQYEKIKIALLIGIKILVLLCLLSLLNGCMRKEIQYIELEREPITCIEKIKTPEDMLECLNEYSIKY